MWTCRWSIPALFLAATTLVGISGCRRGCAQAEDDARALVDQMAACNAGDECQAVDLYEIAGDNNCTGAFQCSTAVRKGTDLEAFRSRAREIASDKKACGSCVIAGCVDPASLRAVCNTTTKRCEQMPDR